MKRILAICLLLALSVGDGLTTEGSPEALRVTFHEGRLSIHAEKVPLPILLAEVVRVTGSRIVGRVEEPHAVSIELKDAPVQQALERLLGSQPFATRYRGERLSVIELVDRGKGGEPVIVYPTPARDISPTAQLTVPVSGALATRLGSQRGTLPVVMTIALGDPDTTLRTAASNTVASALNADAGLRDEFIATYGRMADEAIEHLMRGMPGAEAFFADLEQNARSDEIRDKARTIRHRLHASEPSRAPGGS